MKKLEGHIDGLERILGNSDRLRPGRENRARAALPIHFDDFRKQATNLHKAICLSMRCSCLGTHSSQLFLWRSNDNSQNSLLHKSTQSLILKVYFPRRFRKWSRNPLAIKPDNDWYASNVETPKWPRLSWVPSRIDEYNRQESVEAIPDDAAEIKDLCGALYVANEYTSCLGYLRGDDNTHLIIHKSREDDISPSSVRRVIKLRELIQPRQDDGSSIMTEARLPKITRLAIAINLVEAVLQLFDTPWLQDSWGKEDIHFFEDNSGSIYYDKPFLVSDFTSCGSTSQDTPKSYPGTGLPSSVNAMHTYERTKAVLLSLGIMILELWFNRPIESCRWHRDYLNPNGEENDCTRLNTASKWQRLALEEGGTKLHELTSTCIYNSFGMARPDLRCREMQMSIYTNVAEPLKELLKYF